MRLDLFSNDMNSVRFREAWSVTQPWFFIVRPYARVMKQILNTSWRSQVCTIKYVTERSSSLAVYFCVDPQPYFCVSCLITLRVETSKSSFQQPLIVSSLRTYWTSPSILNNTTLYDQLRYWSNRYHCCCGPRGSRRTEQWVEHKVDLLEWKTLGRKSPGA